MSMQPWDVILNGKVIDTVYYLPDCDAEYVRRRLIDHDGYDSNISVRKSYRGRKNDNAQA